MDLKIKENKMDIKEAADLIRKLPYPWGEKEEIRDEFVQRKRKEKDLSKDDVISALDAFECNINIICSLPVPIYHKNEREYGVQLVPVGRYSYFFFQIPKLYPQYREIMNTKILNIIKKYEYPLLTFDIRKGIIAEDLKGSSLKSFKLYYIKTSLILLGIIGIAPSSEVLNYFSELVNDKNIVKFVRIKAKCTLIINGPQLITEKKIEELFYKIHQIRLDLKSIINDYEKSGYKKLEFIWLIDLLQQVYDTMTPIKYRFLEATNIYIYKLSNQGSDYLNSQFERNFEFTINEAYSKYYSNSKDFNYEDYLIQAELELIDNIGDYDDWMMKLKVYESLEGELYSVKRSILSYIHDDLSNKDENWAERLIQVIDVLKYCTYEKYDYDDEYNYVLYKFMDEEMFNPLDDSEIKRLIKKLDEAIFSDETDLDICVQFEKIKNILKNKKEQKL